MLVHKRTKETNTVIIVSAHKQSKKKYQHRAKCFVSSNTKKNTKKRRKKIKKEHKETQKNGCF